MNNRKGVTLIELVVAMSIFMVVATIAVGAFISVVRMKSLTTNMKESQQKLRVAMEMMTRLSRQANSVKVASCPSQDVGVIPAKCLELVFNIDNTTTTPSMGRFILKPDSSNPTDLYQLLYQECPVVTPGLACVSGPANSTWQTATDLLSGSINLNRADTNFTKNVDALPPFLSIKLVGSINGFQSGNTSPYYTDKMEVNTAVVLENLK